MDLKFSNLRLLCFASILTYLVVYTYHWEYYAFYVGEILFDFDVFPCYEECAAIWSIESPSLIWVFCFFGEMFQSPYMIVLLFASPCSLSESWFDLNVLL